MRMVIMGPPGSGKGTIARIIGSIYGVPVVDTGDLLREAFDRGTEHGRVARGYMIRGELVPDEIVIEGVRERLLQPDCEAGFILDGFPRNVAQSEALDRFLAEKGAPLDFVLKVVAAPETIVDRLSLRRICPRCGAVYNLRSRPPKADETCDECGAELVRRPDDREDIVKRRLEVYEGRTRPILERYKKEGRVREISGELDLKEIPDALRRVLERR